MEKFYDLLIFGRVDLYLAVSSAFSVGSGGRIEYVCSGAGAYSDEVTPGSPGVGPRVSLGNDLVYWTKVPLAMLEA